MAFQRIHAPFTHFGVLLYNTNSALIQTAVVGAARLNERHDILLRSFSVILRLTTKLIFFVWYGISAVLRRTFVILLMFLS